MSKWYDFYIPRDLKIGELPAIIKRINEITYLMPNWKVEKKENTSTEEVWIAIKIAISRVLKIRDRIIWEDKAKEEQCNKAISKYISLYQKYFPEDTETNFSSSDFVKNLEQEIKQREEKYLINYEKRYKEVK